MVPPSSHGISRAPRYSGYPLPLRRFAYRILTFFDLPSHAVRLHLCVHYGVLTPTGSLPSVWPLPLSLATTHRISVDFFSSPYLDVSVRAVPLAYLFIQYAIHGLDSMWIAPFGYLRIISCLPIPAAFRSLPRPSSAPDAKAFSLRSY